VTPQVTPRAAPSPINAAYAPSLFWDGRATGQFVDPQTGAVAIGAGGALESQSVAPPVSTVEMAHEGIDWNQITGKLARVRPLDLATGLPADVAAALGSGPRPDYPELFRRAFGDGAITARRIAMAVATYERTLIANQTPWDRFQAGQTNALTQGQQAGLQTFQQNCAVCHTPPFFTNHGFRNIGLRPVAEDTGRQGVTGNFADRGRFKVPSLRNAGLRARFMHNGQFGAMVDVVRFYVRAPGAAPQFPDNRDPAMQNIFFPPQAEPALVDFLVNGLTDPRVAAQTFPFDRPALYTERPNDQATQLGGGLPGSGGVLPRIIAEGPAMVGNMDYRVGVDGALGGATARLGVSSTPPAGGQITPERFLGQTTTAGSGAGGGVGTVHWPLTTEEVSGGQVLFLQWFVDDAGAPGGTALSGVLRVPVFCGSAGCPAVCGYANCDGSTVQPVLNVNDFVCFLNRFGAGDPYANCDGSTTPPVLNVNDFVCFLNRFGAGCQ
jgi:cytochrome c peroxidase